MSKPATYRDSGVDIDAGDRFVGGILSMMKSTFGPEVMQSDRGFAGFFELNNPANQLIGRGCEQPVLVACTDGVGSKLKIAIMANKHNSVGIDLVAMNVNDLIVPGATPLFFLDYIAAAKLDVDRMTDLVEGISEGCRQSGAALLGGETSEMPSLYSKDHYDLAGFAVGIIDKNKIIDGSNIEAGDVILGLASDGLHSNGYSLIQEIFFNRAGWDLDRDVEEFGCTLGEELLKPTKIYVQPVLSVLHHYTKKQAIHGIVNITGGGLTENIPRILPEGLQAQIDRSKWDVPAVFKVTQELGDVETEEMYRVFNMGIGMVMIFPEFYLEAIRSRLTKHQVESFQIGSIVEGENKVSYLK